MAGIVVVASVAAILALASALVGSRQRLNLSTDVLDLARGSEAAVCSSDVDVECAEAAAKRAGRVVAWVSDAPSLVTHDFVVARREGEFPSPRGFVFEEAESSGALIEISTNPRPDSSLKAVRRVSHGTFDILILESSDRSHVALEWSAKGETYRIDASVLSVPMPRNARHDLERVAVTILDRIHYAKP